MNMLDDIPVSTLQFYFTSSYPCSYLPGKMARSQVATPCHLIDSRVYSQLIRAGFRRSGTFTYRPYCDDCHACKPVRLAVADFVPDRSRRRVWKRLHHLQATRSDLYYHPRHYDLYLRYQLRRHHGGGMDGSNREQYHQFLLQSNIDSELIEFHEGDELRMVSIIDQLPDGLSSVYTFFDPDIPGTSFGTYSILWQIALCRELGLPYLYLGYWIKGSRKMQYKADFRPLQVLVNGEWQLLPDSSP